MRRDKGPLSHLVMPGLVPGIHVFDPAGKKDVDGRVKPGHDEGREHGSLDLSPFARN
jgi:hypothetical protein